VYQTWKALTEKQRQESWRIESLRAYAREQEKRKETEARMYRIEQEAAHLRAQLHELSKCQQPREFLLFPPTTFPLPSEVAKVASNTNFDPADWDFDRLTTKWKARIQNERSMAAQSALPNGGPKNWNFSAPTAATGSNGAPAIDRRGGGQGHSHEGNQDDERDDDDDGDMDDAPGDEDDVPADQDRVQQTLMDREVLDPHLRDQDGEMVMDGIEGNGGVGSDGFDGGRMLMGLRDYEVTSGGIT